MKNKIFGDIALNLFASSLSTISLNFVVYPLLARKFSVDDYGNMLTSIAVLNLLIAVLGNCLNNTRLLLNKRIDIVNESGNYNPIIMCSSFMGAFIGIVIYSLIPIKSLVSSMLFFASIAFGIARAYYLVSYRLKIDYVSQLRTNLIVSSSYIIGILLVREIDFWPLPFLLGEMIAFFYMVKNVDLIIEPLSFNEQKKIVISTYFDVMAIGLIGNIIAYFDRFLINPLLGASNVAIFHVAAFWGKSASPVIAPTQNVLLSYLCQKETKISIRRYIKLFICSIIPLVVFGILGIWGAPWIAAVLYPTLVDEAVPFFLLASMGSLIQSATNLISPMIMSVTSSRNLLVMQIIYFLTYLFISYEGVRENGLMGFCIAIVIIGIIKMAIYFVFGYVSISKATYK